MRVPKRNSKALAPTRSVERLYAQALTAQPFLRDQLAQAVFARALDRSVGHRFRDAPPAETDVVRYLDSLHVEDLALAAACGAGADAAWEHLITTLRPTLYAAARTLTKDEAAARELADTLWAELYGVGSTKASVETGTERRPLLTYFHGRSKLSTWLRSVLAQRHVDRIRVTQRVDSLDGDDPAASVAPAATADPDRERYRTLLDGALGAALDGLEAGDRLRLALYYLQGLTLAQIGRITRDHEATISRRLSRTRTRLKRQIERELRDARGLDEAQVRLCYQYALEDGAFDLGAALQQDD
ncbi:MAG: sigma-70 family RNA polymerase sigma factor [Acidobacteria bacterium]|nr:MAG: sigma-70 family RNA polymerase sigma factor [Acidobacteriota bacterium]